VRAREVDRQRAPQGGVRSLGRDQQDGVAGAGPPVDDARDTAVLGVAHVGVLAAGPQRADGEGDEHRDGTRAGGRGQGHPEQRRAGGDRGREIARREQRVARDERVEPEPHRRGRREEEQQRDGDGRSRAAARHEHGGPDDACQGEDRGGQPGDGPEREEGLPREDMPEHAQERARSEGRPEDRGLEALGVDGRQPGQVGDRRPEAIPRAPSVESATSSIINA